VPRNCAVSVRMECEMGCVEIPSRTARPTDGYKPRRRDTSGTSWQLSASALPSPRQARRPSGRPRIAIRSSKERCCCVTNICDLPHCNEWESLLGVTGGEVASAARGGRLVRQDWADGTRRRRWTGSATRRCIRDPEGNTGSWMRRISSALAQGGCRSK
jgi:hypothetical protein